MHDSVGRHETALACAWAASLTRLDEPVIVAAMDRLVQPHQPSQSFREDVGPSQRQVNAIVKSGIFFSILWLMGIGSVMALLRGLEARKIITESRGRLPGMGGAWWCIVVGAFGVLVWAPIYLLGIASQLR